jgi:hypothetical protein
VVADTLSRPPTAVTGVTPCQGGKAEPGTVASVTAHAPLEGLCYAEMVVEQKSCPAVTKAVSSQLLRLQRVNIAGASSDMTRLVMPAAFQRTVFATMHGLAHPGIRATQRMIIRHFCMAWLRCRCVAVV